MKYFVIRQKSTGLLMPRYSGRAGGTHEEPTDKKPPRLFARKQDADAALVWWLQGKTRAKYDFDGEFSELIVKPVADRKAEDMEVITVELELRA